MSMTITLTIDVDGPDIVTFDPAKVLRRIKDHFPNFQSDYSNHAYRELDVLAQYFIDHATPDAARQPIQDELRHKVARIGPVYTFTISVPDGTPIQGVVNRYTTSFRTTSTFDLALQEALIRFLCAFQVGFLTCDRQTPYFTVGSSIYPTLWELNASLISPPQPQRAAGPHTG
jgi:hypothetical protein